MVTFGRVLVTRAAHQASQLAEHLRALGAEPVLLPTIELAAPTSYAALDRAIADLDCFDWLLFTSANAVQSFTQRALSVALPPSLRIAAIGSVTAHALVSAGLTPNLVPTQAVAESLVALLLPHTHRSDGSPARFLLVRAEQARDVLPESLSAAGALVTVVPAYRTVLAETSIALVRTLFSGDSGPIPSPGGVDAIAFTSSSTARNLVALCEAADVGMPATPMRVSVGPITSETLRQLGMPPHGEAPFATMSSLAETVVATLRTRMGR